VRFSAPFWNARERRVRALWRLLAFAVAYVVVLGAVAVVATLARALLRSAALGGATVAATLPLDGVVARALASTVAALITLGLAGLAALALDRRPVADFGLGLDRDWALDCVFGIALGAVLMGLLFAVELAAGWLVVRGTVRTGGLSPPAAFGAAVVLFLAVGLGEELLLRGYVLTNVAEALRGLGNRWALALATLLSAGVFGALHAGNPNATPVSVAAISLAGVMLALGYLLTGELAIPVGLHVGWNLFQGPVFGFPVSGLDLGIALLVVEVRGPERLTGGAFGPEAGLLGVAAMVVGTGAIAGYVRLRHGPLSLAPLSVPRLRWWRWGRSGDD
jgi:membrane protease YdiL (CAAX protease family)